MNKKNELVEIIKTQGLEDESEINSISESFIDFFSDMKDYEAKANAIVVKDETEVEKMVKAREIRLELKKIRTDAEKVRKSKKEFFLKAGKAIDSVANLIKNTVTPLEEHLEKQENFIEIKEEQRKDKLNAERITELSKYVLDVSVFNLRDMTDEAFTILLNSNRESFEAKIKAEKDAEEKRVAEEKAKQEEYERMKIENEKIKTENERITKENADKEAKMQEQLNKERKEKEEADRKLKEKESEEKRIEEENKQKESDKARLEKETKYKNWLKDNGYNEEDSKLFHIENKIDVVILYKVVSIFNK